MILFPLRMLLMAVSTSATPSPLTTPGALIVKEAKSDYLPVVDSIVQLLKSEDETFLPLFLRLAFNSLSTFNPQLVPIGGSNGGCIRSDPESSLTDNVGLSAATEILEIVKTQHPFVTYSDLYQLAANVAIEWMGGPNIVWRPGRLDYADEDLTAMCVDDTDRLPQSHVQGDVSGYLFQKFSDLGINVDTDPEGCYKVVALMGAHTVGSMHNMTSGVEGSWTVTNYRFNNDYFTNMIAGPWEPATSNAKGFYYVGGPDQMFSFLPIDMILSNDTRLFQPMQEMQRNEEIFFKYFAEAWNQIQENGVDFGEDSTHFDETESSRVVPEKVFAPCPGSSLTRITTGSKTFTISYQFGFDELGRGAIRFVVTNTNIENGTFWGSIGFRVSGINNNMNSIFPIAWDNEGTAVHDMQPLNGYPQHPPSLSNPTLNVVTESFTVLTGSVTADFWRLLDTGDYDDIRLLDDDYNIVTATGSGILLNMDGHVERTSDPVRFTGRCVGNSPTSEPTSSPVAVTGVPDRILKGGNDDDSDSEVSIGIIIGLSLSGLAFVIVVLMVVAMHIKCDDKVTISEFMAATSHQEPCIEHFRC